MARYTVHPLDKKFHEWEQEHKEQRNRYWRSVHTAREDYMHQYRDLIDQTAKPLLHNWLEEHYGIRMGIDDQGNYTADYQVTDEKKFMMFKLRYWQ